MNIKKDERLERIIDEAYKGHERLTAALSDPKARSKIDLDIEKAIDRKAAVFIKAELLDVHIGYLANKGMLLE